MRKSNCQHILDNWQTFKQFQQEHYPEMFRDLHDTKIIECLLVAPPDHQIFDDLFEDPFFWETLYQITTTPDRIYEKIKLFRQNNAPIKELVEAAKDPANQKVKCCIASALKIEEEQLEQLLQGQSEWAKAAKEAINPNTPPETLERLAKTQDFFIEKAVASNPNTPAQTLEYLTNNPTYEIKERVASNPNTPIPILEHLAKNWGKTIIENVLKNPSTPDHIKAICKRRM